MAILSYPYERLERVSRRHAASVSSWARSMELASLVRGAQRAESWLGTDFAATPTSPARSAQSFEATNDPAVILESGQLSAGLVIDFHIADALILRTLGADPGAELSTGPLRDVELGVLHYAVARWLADGRSPFRASAVLGHFDAREIMARADEPLIASCLEIRLGDRRGRATVIMPERPALTPAARSLPSWTHDVPVVLVVDAGVAILPARDVAALQPSDIVLPDHVDCVHVVLRTRDASQNLRCRVVEGDLEITERLLSRPIRSGTMETDAMKNATSDHDDLCTPVTLSIELARLTLPLGEVASLAVGEIVRTQHAIGERVTLRAGERVIAHGELVDVEGELGVRVLETTAHSP